MNEKKRTEKNELNGEWELNCATLYVRTKFSRECLEMNFSVR